MSLKQVTVSPQRPQAKSSSSFITWLCLYTLSTVHNHIRSSDKLGLITCQEQTHIGNIFHLRQPAQWHIKHKLGPVLRRVLHSGELREETGAGEQRANVVDANIVLTKFRREGLGRLAVAYLLAFLFAFCLCSQTYIRDSCFG
jgi:hypothetical protein